MFRDGSSRFKLALHIREQLALAATDIETVLN